MQMDLDAIFNHSKRQVESDQFAVTRISSKALMQIIEALRIGLKFMHDYRGSEDVDKTRAEMNKILHVREPGVKEASIKP